jgi:arylsulfatase A-like enzyme
MKRTTYLSIAALVSGAALTNSLCAQELVGNPNIIYILCDDLGYGDVKCLGGERSKIATPNIDRLAAGGMIFTEAHSSSSVCTPTRYGILTGRYNWRTRLQHGVLNGYGTPLIDKNRLTVPAFLKQHGYVTACIGKWHLGMDIDPKNPMAPVADGPTTRGFDHYFGISASLDMPPFAFIENDRFTEAPMVQKTWGRSGAAAPGFDAADVLPTLARKAAEYITSCSKEPTPFFLYLPLPAPHAPIVPTKQWQGKSGLNPYGDFVMEIDWAAGEVLAALDRAGVANNTLVVFTSDNGCWKKISQELEGKAHFPSELRRGYKTEIWDGGHRVPFIVRWPDRIKAGGRTDQLTCLTDLMATCADIVGAKLPDDAAEDSVSLLPVLLGTATGPIREAAVHHSKDGNFAIRQGQWKLALSVGRGKGNDAAAPGELYDMSKDIGEQANQYHEYPEIVSRLTTLLKKYVADGRSTPGMEQENDVEVRAFPSQPAATPKKKAKAAKVATRSESTTAAGNPNILIILADDLGYGDVQCYNPERGKIPTPHVDKLAAQGMRFTDGHSSSGVCTPSRYTLLTGRYHWRTRLQRGKAGNTARTW